MLDQESLMRAAERATGFSEWGDAVFREPLAILTRAIRDEASLHELGFAGRSAGSSMP